MKLSLKIAAILFTILFFILMVTRTPIADAQTQIVTAGQSPRFKNIKVLNDMPADQLGKVMNIFAASLGVDCSFCHNTKDYSSDEKREKQTARKMIQMTFDINKANFGGRTQVTCNSCHNGHEHPTSAPNLWPTPAPAEQKQPDPKPTGDQILANYLAAVGGKDKVAKVTSRHITAIRLEPDGKSETEDIWQKGQNIHIVTTYPENVTVTLGFDGTNPWVTSSKGGPVHLNPDDLAQVKRGAQLLFNPDIMSVYKKLDYRFTDEIDGKPIYLVTGTTADGQVDRLGFDVATGLLVRRVAIIRTVLGPFAYETDYSDYRDFGGVKIPTTIKLAQPGVRFTRKVTKVKINAPVADNSIFNEPKK